MCRLKDYIYAKTIPLIEMDSVAMVQSEKKGIVNRAYKAFLPTLT